MAKQTTDSTPRLPCTRCSAPTASGGLCGGCQGPGFRRTLTALALALALLAGGCRIAEPHPEPDCPPHGASDHNHDVHHDCEGRVTR